MNSVYTAQNGSGWCGYVDFTETVDRDNNQSIISWTGGLHNPTISTQHYTEIKGIKLYIRVLGDVTLNGVRGGSNGTGLTIWVSPENVQKTVYVGGNGSNKTPLNSGSFTIGHTSDGTASFQVAFVAWIYNGSSGFTEWRNRPAGQYDTLVCETISRYTNPTAPTNFTVEAWHGNNWNERIWSQNYIPASTKFKFIIIGASGGTNNPISGYQIDWILTYLGPGSNQTKKTITVSGTTEKIDPPWDLNNYRGYKISFQIRSMGTQSGYNSNYVTSADWYNINRLPSAPTGSNLVIKQDETSGHINVFPGSDEDSQNYSVYWSSSSNGSYSLYNSEKKFQINTAGSTQKYYFKTYDGLEYSSSAVFSIKRNRKAEITCSEMTTITGVSGHPNFQSIQNNVSYVYSIQLNGLSSYGESYTGIKVELAYQNLSSTIPGNTTEFTAIKVVGTFSSIQSLASYVIYPRTYIGENKFYRLKITPIGTTIENPVVTTIYCPKNANGKPFALAPAPVELSPAYYNNFSNSSIGDNPQIFWNEVRFRYTYDNTYNFSTFCGNERLSFISGAENSNTHMYFDVSVLSSISSGKQTFKNSLIPIGGGAETSYTYELIEINNISLPVFETNRNIIKPFTDGDPFLLYFTKFYGDATNSLQYYGLKSLNTANTTTSFIINNTAYSIPLHSVSIPPDKNDRIEGNFSIQTIYDALKDKIAQSGAYSTYIDIKIENLFKKVSSFRVPFAINISYSEPLEITFTTDSVTRTGDSTKPVHEGETLLFSPIIKGYSNTTISYQIQISKDEKKTWTDYLTGQTMGAAGAVPSRKKPIAYDISSMRKVVSEITDNNDCYFRIIATNNHSSVTSGLAGPFTRYKFIAPRFQLLSATADGSTLNVQYTVTDIGTDLSNPYYSIDTKNAKLVLKYDLSSESAVGQITTLSNPTDFSWNNFVSGSTIFQKGISQGADSWLCSLTCSIALSGITDTGGNPIIKTSTQYIRYFILQPTVAYRKNRLGINTTSIDNISDAVMVVRAPSEAVKYIYFLGATDSPTGNEWNSVPFIDLENRTINNLIINGGSW